MKIRLTAHFLQFFMLFNLIRNIFHDRESFAQKTVLASCLASTQLRILKFLGDSIWDTFYMT